MCMKCQERKKVWPNSVFDHIDVLLRQLVNVLKSTRTQGMLKFSSTKDGEFSQSEDYLNWDQKWKSHKKTKYNGNN